MILLKFLAVPVVGAGAVGTMSPLIYAGTTSSTFKTSGKGYLSTLSPVLQDCEASDGKYYTVLLDYNPESQDSSKNPEVSFRIEETSGKGSNNKGKVVGRKGLTSNSLGDGGLQPQTNTKFDFMYPDPSGTKHGNQIRKGKATCSGEGVIQSINGFSNTIELRELNLTMDNEKTCQSSFGYVECSIIINSSEKLKGIDGKQPKIIYTAF